MSNEINEIVTKNFVTGGFKNEFEVVKAEAKYNQNTYTTEHILKVIISLSSFTKKTIEEIELKEDAKDTIDKLNEFLNHLANLASKMIKRDYPKQENRYIIDSIDVISNDIRHSNTIDNFIKVINEAENFGIKPIII